MVKESWIPILKIQHYIQIDAYLFFWILLFLSFLFYKIFLRKITERRHKNLRARFLNTLIFLSVSSALSMLYFQATDYLDPELIILRIANYVALTALFFGATAAIKVAQIYIYLYLFLTNSGVGVPKLIGNIFTIIFSLLVFGYLGADVFGIHFKTMLATSAFFSIVLGLALQDTLGNLFSGIAMQMGRPFIIGDWVEIASGSEKWTGQIQEISWRATAIMTFSDELILIPNKVIAQSNVTIYTHNQRPVRHGITFRFPFESDFTVVERELLGSAQKVADILHDPAPRVLLIETTESFVTVKLIYSIADYSRRFGVADLLIKQVLSDLKFKGIALSTNQLLVKN